MSAKFVSLRKGLRFMSSKRLGLRTAYVVCALFASSSVLAQTDNKDVTPRHGPLGADKITAYPNGVFHVAPLNFGVTSAVRDFPISVPNAAEIAADSKVREINPLNKRVIKPIIPGAGAGSADFKDPLVDRSRANLVSPAMPAPGLTFNGASQVDNTAQGIG